MSLREARFIKKKVKTGTVDIHPTDNALIVNYEVEALILGEDGKPMIGDQKKCQKMIRFHSLNPSTNCTALAKDVINKCKLIHPSKLDEVQHLLRYLQYRKQCASSILAKSNEAVNLTSPLEEHSLTKVEEKANLLDLEDYIELLYEEMCDKVRGSGLILQLCSHPSNLQELTVNESLISVLTRVLREDWKKSLDITINLVGIFEKFSEYTRFQPIVLQQKIGSLCIEIVTDEIFKYDSSFASKEEPTDPKSFRSRLPVPRSATKSAGQKSRSQIPVKNASADRHSLVNDEHAEKRDLSSRKMETIIKKQDQVFNMCISLLLHISENERIEDKMRKRGLIPLLIKLLSRNSVSLLIIVLKFLLKLSVYKENKEEMARLNVVEKLTRIQLLSSKETKLLDLLLPLLFNFSFDRDLCDAILRAGFLPEIVKLTGKSGGASMAEDAAEKSRHHFVLGLLYHLTMDDRVKSMLAYTDCMNTIVDLILNPDHQDDSILNALCVNLALNSKCCEALCDHRVISAVIEKAFSKKDSVSMKMIRNIVSHPVNQHLFEIYASEAAKSLKLYLHSHTNFSCECIGFLANLLTTDVDFNALFKKFQLFPLIKQCFSDLDYVTDDVRLELLILLGTVSYDETMADNLFHNDILPLLIKLIKDKQEDDEIVLQIIFIFYQVLQHPLTRDYVTKQIDAPLYFIDLLHDNNANIRKTCRACLDIVKEFDDTWIDRVKTEKFQWHNSHWLEMIQNQMMSFNNNDESTCNDDILPQYNLLQQSLMFQSGSHPSLSVDGSMEILSNIMNSEDSQSISEYNSDIDMDMEFSRKASTPYDERYDLSEGFNNLVFDDKNGLELM